MNYSKEDIANEVKKRADYYQYFAEFGTDEDKWNYEVSYAKIQTLGFDTTVSLEEGIDELIKAAGMLDINNEFSNV